MPRRCETRNVGANHAQVDGQGRQIRRAIAPGSPVSCRRMLPGLLEAVGSACRAHRAISASEALSGVGSTLVPTRGFGLRDTAMRRFPLSHDSNELR